MNFFKRTTRGMGIIEILIGAAIISTGVIVLVNTYGVYVRYALTHDEKNQATYLLQEGVEAMSLLRDQSWSTNINSLSTATTSLYWNATKWEISSTTDEYIDGRFTRNVKVTPVYRDSNGRVTESGGTLDTLTKLVTVTVSYQENNATTTATLSKYLVNMYVN